MQFAIRFIYKNPALCVPRFFIEFLKFAEGGGHLFIKNTMHLRYFVLYKVPVAMPYILIYKKLCIFLYVYMNIVYRAVLIPNYKRTYDKSDQIEKEVRALYWELVLFLRSIKSFRYLPQNESEQPVLGWNTSLSIIGSL